MTWTARHWYEILTDQDSSSDCIALIMWFPLLRFTPLEHAGICCNVCWSAAPLRLGVSVLNFDFDDGSAAQNIYSGNRRKYVVHHFQASMRHIISLAAPHFVHQAWTPSEGSSRLQWLHFSSLHCLRSLWPIRPTAVECKSYAVLLSQKE